MPPPGSSSRSRWGSGLCAKAAAGPGDQVLVSGGGPIGAMVAQAARACGAAEVVVTDPVESRRRRIAGFGATRTLHPVEDEAEIAKISADGFIECSGSPRRCSSESRRYAGADRSCWSGWGQTGPRCPWPTWTRRRNLTGVFRYVDTWPRGIALAEAGMVQLDDMVTHRYGLEDVEEALDADADPESLKAVVEVAPPA